KIHYCKKEILIDIDIDKYVKLHSYDGTPYCILGDETLIFLESNKFNDYQKKNMMFVGILHIVPCAFTIFTETIYLKLKEYLKK
ncbi:19436_t:CDS:1, partial [Racocetra persica]